MTGTSPFRRAGSAFCLGIDYSASGHDELSTVDDAAELAAFLTRQGFDVWGPPPGVSAAVATDIVNEIVSWVESIRTHPGRVRSAIIYVGGHGRNYIGSHYTLAAPSPAAPPFFNQAIKADDVIATIAETGADVAVVIFDSCFSGGAAADVLNVIADRMRYRGTPDTTVVGLAAAWTNERAESGALVQTMLQVLNSFDPGESLLTAKELANEVNARLAGRQTVVPVGDTGERVFPNGNYRPDGPERSAVYSELLAGLDPADREHFLAKAAGTDINDLGWLFSGRVQPSRQIVEWLASTTQGVLVVTGPPGAGKSAVLGRLALLADRGSQRACELLGMTDGDTSTRPELGEFDAVLHLRDKGYIAASMELAEQLGLELSDELDPTSSIRSLLAESGRRVCVLADALDEAATAGDIQRIAEDLLRPLSKLAGCKVIVGSRRDRDGIVEPTEDDPGPLIRAFGTPAVIDLADDPHVDVDIADYVDRSLERTSGSWPTPSRRQTAGAGVARAADGVFLFARFAIRALAAQPETITDRADWTDQLPSDAGRAGLHEVFRLDLARFPEPELIREALRPLAFALGRGLPRREIWPALATELSSRGRAYTETDIASVIRHAGWYLIQATQDGQTVFRLYHQAIADYLREDARHAL